MNSIVVASPVARSCHGSLAGLRMVSQSRPSRNSWHNYALMTMAREVVKDTDIGGCMLLDRWAQANTSTQLITDNSVC